MSSKESKLLLKKKKNSYMLAQFKKMIGKNLVSIWSGVIYDKKVVAEEAKKIKENILNGSIRQIGMIGYVSENGTLYIFSGVEKLFVIAALSYLDIKKYKLDVDINVVQYPKLDKATIAKFSV